MLQRSRRSLLSLRRLLGFEDALSVRTMLSGRPWICASCRHRTIASRREYTQEASSQLSPSEYQLDYRALESMKSFSNISQFPSHFQRSAFLPSNFASPPSTLLVPKKRMKPAIQELGQELTTEISIRKQKYLRYHRSNKSPRNARDGTIQARMVALKLTLKPALYTSTMSEWRLRLVALKYQKVLEVWYKHAQNTIRLDETPFSDEVALPDGTKWTVHELCIQLMCRFYGRQKTGQRTYLFRTYETLRNAAPEFLATFQQSVILAMTQENDLHQAETWARRFIKEGNLKSAEALIPLIARLIQVPFGLPIARSLAEDAFELTAVDGDVAYLLCIGIAKSAHPYDLPRFVELFAAGQGSFGQERFVNILYNLALRGHNEVVLDLYVWWRSTCLKEQDQAEKEEWRKHSATIYTIVLKAMLNRYPTSTDGGASSIRRRLNKPDTGSKLPRQLTELFENMSADDIEMDASMLPALIAGLASAKKTELAMQTAHFAMTMDKEKLNYGAIVKTIVRVLLDEGRRDEAKELLKKVGESEKISTHNLILRMILNYDLYDNFSVPTPEAFSEAMKHFQEMAVKPDHITAKNMMIAALRLEETEAAFEVLRVTGGNAEPHLWHSLLVHITRDIYNRTAKAMDGQGSAEGLPTSIDLLRRVIISAIDTWKAESPRKYNGNDAYKEIFRTSLLKGILGVHYLPLRPSVRVDFDQSRQDMEDILEILRAGKVPVSHGTVEAVVKKAIDGRLIRSDVH